jgi:hypothetical protein
VALKQLLDSNAKFKVKEAEERQIRMELDLQQQQATAKISQLQMEGNAQVSLLCIARVNVSFCRCSYIIHSLLTFCLAITSPDIHCQVTNFVLSCWLQ